MGDGMLLAVLRMPPDCWHGSPLDIGQRHARYVEAADYIEALKRSRQMDANENVSRVNALLALIERIHAKHYDALGPAIQADMDVALGLLPSPGTVCAECKGTGKHYVNVYGDADTCPTCWGTGTKSEVVQR